MYRILKTPPVEHLESAFSHMGKKHLNFNFNILI